MDMRDSRAVGWIDSPAGRQESTLSDVDLVRVQRNLQLLLAFLEA